MAVHFMLEWVIFIYCSVSCLSEELQVNVLMYPNATVKRAVDFLTMYNKRATEMSKRTTRMSWQYETDLTEYNLRRSVESSTEATKFFIEGSDNATSLMAPELPKDTTRQLMLISRSASPKVEDKLRLLNELQAKMTQTYSKGKVYYLDKQTGKPQYLELEPDLMNIMAKSRDYDKLLFAWKGWRDAVGPQIKPLYEQFVNIVNVGAREHDWVDNGYFERSHYELGADFMSSLNKVWSEIRPLYEELHAFVRYKLSLVYKNVSLDRPIPAHVLGDMWAQHWENIFDLVNPYPNSSSFDVTANLQAQNYTVQKMFELAQSFYISLGLDPMPFAFWNMSLFEKPKKRKAVCHASAWDFSDGEVRIKMCTKITHSDLIVIHHEMGHCVYFLAYKDKPFAYRGGANPGFHEAVGDTITLSVENPTYFQQTGLRYAIKDSLENSISFLLRMALQRVALVPFAFLVDQWRWKAFSGNITMDTYNSEWWNLRTRYQGIAQPVKRHEKDFDPGAKFHIAANSPYISYFFSHILQFQFHRALCKIAKSNETLHKCSIHKSKAAGAKFREMLAAGSSEPWPQILYKLTGERELRVDAMLEYFEPLLTWLKSYRTKMNYTLGWNTSESCTGNKPQAVMKELDKPIILTNSSNMGLSYLRAVANASKSMQANKTEHSGRQTIEDIKKFSGVILLQAASNNGARSPKSRGVLGPLGQTKSSILTRPVFVPSSGKDPLTLVKKNDGNKYNAGFGDLYK